MCLCIQQMSVFFYLDCSRIIKNMRRHLNTIKHISNSNEIKYTIPIKNVMVKDVNSVIDKHIERYKKKFLASTFIRKINSLTIVGYPKTKMFLERCNKKDKVNVYLTSYSELKDVSYSYHLQMGKPMIENKMLKNLNYNPNLVKSMTISPSNPLTRHIILNY